MTHNNATIIRPDSWSRSLVYRKINRSLSLYLGFCLFHIHEELHILQCPTFSGWYNLNIKTDYHRHRHHHHHHHNFGVSETTVQICIEFCRKLILIVMSIMVHTFMMMLWNVSVNISVSIYIGFKTFFYVVRHLYSVASCLPTGLHLGFFHSWPSLYLPSSFSSVFLVVSFVSASTSMLFWVIFLLPLSEHGHTM